MLQAMQQAPHVRIVAGRGSWRTRALNAVLRFGSRTPLRQDADIAAHCHAAYQWLLHRGSDPGDVVIVGDSAGGNLALVTLQRALAHRDALPSCAVLLSPGVDCTFTGDSLVDNQDRDAMLRLDNLLVMRSHYVPSAQLYTHPEVSPLFADFRGFPPLFLQAGSSEILRDEATRTAQKAHAAGVHVELELWPETPHVFQLAPFLPEAALAVEQIVKFIVARTGWETLAPAQ